MMAVMWRYVSVKRILMKDMTLARINKELRKMNEADGRSMFSEFYEESFEIESDAKGASPMPSMKTEGMFVPRAFFEKYMQASKVA